MPRVNVSEQTVSLPEAAMVAGVSTPILRDLQAKGLIAPVKTGRYPLVATVSAYTKRLREQAAGRVTDGSKTELAKAQAAIAQAKAGLLNRKLIEVEDVEIDHRGKVRQLRAAFLALPSRIAGMVPTLGREGAEIIAREVRDVLTDVANEPPVEEAGISDMARGTDSAAATAAIGVDRGNLYLPSDVSALPGRIRLYPYQRGIADAISDPLGERVTMVKAARVGFTTILTGCIASYVANEPSPILAVLPTESDCRDYMVTDVEPIFKASLRSRVRFRSVTRMASATRS